MAAAPNIPVSPEPVLVAFHQQRLPPDVADYLNHLAEQSPRQPLTLTIKIHPLNISEGLAHELAAHERGFLRGDEKTAAHEFSDPLHPRKFAVPRHELCGLIAEMTAPLADTTFAHHLWFILTIGKELPAPFVADRIGICASFDGRHGTMRQRFSPERETMAPASEPIVASGMTLVCEPLESGYYHIPEDTRFQSAEGLLMSDSIYRWTLRSLIVLQLAMNDYEKLEPDERDTLLSTTRDMRTFFRLLAIGHPEMRYLASLSGFNLVQQLGFQAEEFNSLMERMEFLPEETPRPAAPKIVFGRFAGAGSTVQPRNIEHQAAYQLTERPQANSQHPVPHTHLSGPNFQPE